MKAIIDGAPHVTGLTGLNRAKPGRVASLQGACTERRDKCAARRMHMHGCVQDRCRVPLITDKRLDKLARAPEVA
jgi:hypothetical protein